MNRSLIRRLTYLQLFLAVLMATGCTPTQPFFMNESPDLQYYLNSATQIEYPDVDIESLPETTEAYAPLTIGNHDYDFWDLSVEECVSIALNNAQFFVTTSGNAEFRQNVAAQFAGASADQLGSIYDIAITQSTTQSIPLTIDGNGNRTLPRGVLRANQIGGVEDALAEFDAVASGFFNFSTTDRPRNTGDSQVSRQVSQATDVTQQAALSKRYATGGVATLREQIIYGRSNLPTGGLNSAARLNRSDYTFLLEAQVQHPLMRNRGTFINRIPVVLASLNEDIAMTDFEIQIRNLVRDIEVAYWDLYVAYRNVSTTVVGRNSAIATAKFAELALENGTGTKQEVAQAYAQYYNFASRLAGALAGSNLPGDDRLGVYGAERVLREKMGLAATDGRLIRPTEEPSLARVEFDWTEIVSQMLYLSPELRRARTVIKQRELELASAKNQLLPEVNLSLLYRWVGVGDTLGPPGRQGIPSPLPGSSALGTFTGGDYQEGAIRLEITPPALGARRERARIRGSQLRETQAIKYLEENERMMVSLLSDAKAKTDVHYRQVQERANEWQSTEVEVEARLAEFRTGRSDINVVLQSQQRRADAQINYYRALSEYNKSINYVDYLKGTMLVNSNIMLREGTWNKKAYWDALERARERSAGKKVQYGVTRPNVVRRGPVGDANTAANFVGDSSLSEGQSMPPQFDPMTMSNEIILDGPQLGSDRDLMGGNMGVERQTIEIPQDMPLSEMGDSTFELQSPSPEPRGFEPSELLPPQPGLPQQPGRNEGLNVPQPQPDPAPHAALPSHQQPIGSALASPHRSVAPINHEQEIDISGNPSPVRRRSIPVR